MADNNYNSSLSIIIPVFNDTRSLIRLLKQIKSKKINCSPELIIAVTKSEFKFVKSRLKKHKLSPVIVESKKGRANQMNAAVKFAKGKFLLFLHADSNIKYLDFLIILNFTNTVSNNFFASFKIKFESKKIYFRFIELISYLRQRVLKIPFGDQGLFIPKSLFLSAGGFQVGFEDMSFAKKIKKLNIPLTIFDQEIISSPRRFLAHGIIFTHWIMFCIFWAEIFGFRSLAIYFYKFIK